MNGRSPRRARRRDARRDAILRAAGRIFRERGFAQTGMRDIADAADLSPANLYHYFRGKDEILFYCQDRALDRMLAAVARRGRAGRPADRLHALLTAHLRTLLDEVDGASAHLQIESLPQALRGRIVRKRDRYERALRRQIEDGVRAGAFVAPDPAIVTRAILGALNWTVTWFRHDGAHDADVVSGVLADFVLRGVERERSDRGQTGVRPGSNRGETPPGHGLGSDPAHARQAQGTGSHPTHARQGQTP